MKLAVALACIVLGSTKTRAQSPTYAPTSCRDRLWFYYGVVDNNCTFIDATEQRRQDFCKHIEVHRGCPAACGLCDKPDRPYIQYTTNTPSAAPSTTPPTVLPTVTDMPSASPTISAPTDKPSTAPSTAPSKEPSLSPSDVPSLTPSAQPSREPSVNPSSEPYMLPTKTPRPSDFPSEIPSAAPSAHAQSPTYAPTSCRDSLYLTFFYGVIDSNCMFIDATEQRRQDFCRHVEVHRGCPAACGLCDKPDRPYIQYTTNTPSAAPSTTPPTVSPTALPTTSAPTSNPTDVPTGAPSRPPSSEPSDTPNSTDVPRPFTVECVQDPNIFFDGIEGNGCAWLNYSKSRRERKCHERGGLNKAGTKPNMARLKCPASCGFQGCCADDLTYMFKNDNEQTVKCAWIAQNADQLDARRKYCSNKKEVFGHCLKSCGMCYDRLPDLPKNKNKNKIKRSNYKN